MGVHSRRISRKNDRQLVELIGFLYGVSHRNDSPLWRDVARRLEGPTARRPCINLSRIERFTVEGETVVIPGKVLAGGQVSKKITVGAYALSENAIRKLNTAGCRVMDLKEMASANPKGSNVKILM